MSTHANDNFHPDFTLSQLDNSDPVVLVSKEGMRLAVSKTMLDHSSAFFRTMLSLPQTKDTHAVDQIRLIDNMDESTDTLHCLAAYVEHKPLPDLHDVSQIAAILRAADKYEMPGLTSVMRLAMRNSSLKSRPVQRYILAVRYGWDDLRELAQAVWLELPADLDVPNDDFALLQPLLMLRQRRHDHFKRKLDDAVRGTDVPQPDTQNIWSSHSDLSGWCSSNVIQVLFWRLQVEFAMRPSGGFIQTEEYTNWSEWAAICSHSYAKDKRTHDYVQWTKNFLQKLVNGLPST